MRRTILFAILLVGLISAALLGAAIYAYFSDTAKSTENIFTAGTFDLKLSNDGLTWTDDVSATWVAPAWCPGDELTATLNILNDGTMKIVTMKIKPTDLVDVSGLASQIFITDFTVAKPGKVMSHMESWMEPIFGNGDGTFTLEEFATSPYWFYTGEEDGAIDPGDTGYVMFTFLFNPDAGDTYQGTTCSFDLTINAIQGPADYTVIGDCGYGY